MSVIVVGISGIDKHLYALRSDGAVFVLLRRGDLDPGTGKALEDPRWERCPAVPGTEAATEQAG